MAALPSTTSLVKSAELGCSDVRPPPSPAFSSKPGLLFYVMVDSVAKTLDKIVANGGIVVQPIGADAPEITARFSDPAGNVIGLYQQPS